MSVQILSIHRRNGQQDDPHQSIEALGWKNERTGKSGRSDLEQMWIWVERGGEAFVTDGNGNAVRVRAKRTCRGAHFLQAETDDGPTDALLRLPEF